MVLFFLEAMTGCWWLDVGCGNECVRGRQVFRFDDYIDHSLGDPSSRSFHVWV